MSHRRRVVNRRPACRLFATRTLIVCHMGCEQPLGRTARLRRWLAGRAAVCNPPPVSNSRRAILNGQKSSRNRAISLAIYVSRAVWDVNAWDVTYEPPLAFAAGRFGVLEIGRKLPKGLRNSKPPYLQVAKAKRCFATASSVLFRQTARRDASPHRSYLTSRLPNGHPF